MTLKTTISGWGNYPRHESQIIIPSTASSLCVTANQEEILLARGMGRSYGDSANANTVVCTTNCDHFLDFDEVNGLLTAESGITLREILRVILSKGWFLPVTPGTSYVTLGGAIASDVHGKNHHISGTFGEHVTSLILVLGGGEPVVASRHENADLFYATCGGMGLTGIIVAATIQLVSIRSLFINQQTIKAGCIESALDIFEDNNDATYSVAWIDCLAKRKNLGRSVLMLGEHAEEGGLETKLTEPIAVPFHTPSALLTNLTMKAFNTIYWHKAKNKSDHTVPLIPYFYPLDAISNWNKLYGKAGFLQFQCVVPKSDGVAGMRKLLTEVANSGQGSFLAVLKQFGKSNENLLSFPTEGYTLALDFKLNEPAMRLVKRLEAMIVDMGGRLYLAKDAVMQESTFKATYPNWRQFESVREKYGVTGQFRSTQSKRLGLA